MSRRAATARPPWPPSATTPTPHALEQARQVSRASVY